MWRVISAGWRISPASTALARTRSIPAVRTAFASAPTGSTGCQGRAPFARFSNGTKARRGRRCEAGIAATAKLGVILAAYRGVGDRTGKFVEPLLEASALFGGVERSGGELGLPQPPRPEGSAVAISDSIAPAPLARTRSSGSWPAGNVVNARLRPRREHRQRAMRGPQRRFLSRRIAVEAQDRHGDHPPQPFDLCLGQARCRAARRPRRCQPAPARIASI